MDGSALGYTELLRLAVSKGLQELDVTVVEIPAEANGGHAVVLATARTTASLYRALGEAWWSEAGSGRPPQALVLAESRAKTGALCEVVGMPRVAEPTGSVEAARESGPRAARSSGPPTEPKPAPRPLAAAQQERDTPPAAGPARGAVGDAPERPEQPLPPRVAEQAAPARPAAAARGVPVAEGLGPDILQRLLQMTRRIGELKHEELSEEEALTKLDSFFLRAFNHPLAEATRVEGQRVVQRLAGDLSRLSQEMESDVAS